MPIDTAIPSGKASIRKLSDERLFFTALARHHVMAVVIGFGRTYYLRAFIPPPEFIKPATPLVHLHGMLFSAWIALFMVQTSLVAAGRRDLHMKLGLAGLPLVLSMIVVGDLGGSATDRATGHSAGSAIVAGRADAGGRGLRDAVSFGPGAATATGCAQASDGAGHGRDDRRGLRAHAGHALHAWGVLPAQHLHSGADLLGRRPDPPPASVQRAGRAAGAVRDRGALFIWKSPAWMITDCHREAETAKAHRG